MPDALIIDAVRTPMGKLRGALKDVRPDDLASLALRAVLERNGVPAARPPLDSGLPPKVCMAPMSVGHWQGRWPVLPGQQ